MPLTRNEADRLCGSLGSVIDTVKSMANGEPAGRTLGKAAAAGDKASSIDTRYAGTATAPNSPVPPALRDPDTLEWLYRQFKNRMIDDLKTDPIFLQLIQNQNEIVIEIQPKVVTVDGDSLRGRLARLIASGFFDSGKRQGEARSELARTGSDPNSGQLSTLFGEFVRDGFLEKTAGDRYMKAPGLKISEKRLEK